LEHVGSRKDGLRLGLWRHYGEHKPFVEDLQAFATANRAFLCRLTSRWENVGTRREDGDWYVHSWRTIKDPERHVTERRSHSIVSAVFEKRRYRQYHYAPCERGRRIIDRYSEMTLNRVTRYRDEFVALTTAWGLRADWARSALHESIRRWASDSDFPLLPWMGSVYVHDAVPPPMPHFPHPGLFSHREDYFANVAAMADDAWREHESRLRATGDWALYDTRPQLSTHLEWLFLRICPTARGGPTLGPAEIARRASVEPKTVKTAIDRLAEEIGIEVERLPAGRPRKLRGIPQT
jgi:hypothetical protein